MTEVKRKINWGVSDDLQADIRYEPNACKSYVMDISLGCSHHCIYCLFSPLELMVYKLKNPGYSGNVLPLKLDKFLSRTEFPPCVYLCYSSDPLGTPELADNVTKILKKLFEHNVSVLFITKGIFPDAVIDLCRERPDLMEIQVGIANHDDQRNKIVEPHAPLYAERLKNLERLSAIDGLGSLVVRVDPLLPEIDDTEENVGRIIDDVSKLGIKEAVMGYVILTQSMIGTLKKNDFTRPAAMALSEKTPTISEQELYSLPFDVKLKRLNRFRQMCEAKGVKLSVCGCKENRFKETDLEWICHPFNRQRREEFARNTGIEMETDHLI